jgi:hypothetical protein
VKDGHGKDEIGKKMSEALVAEEADVVVASGEGAPGLSSDGGGGGPVPIVGSPGTMKTRTSHICAGALEGFGSPSKEPSDEDAPRLKDPPEWGMAVAARASNAQPDTSVEEGTDEDDEEYAGSDDEFKPTAARDDSDYDDAMFDSETEPLEDLSYYRVKAQKVGRRLNKGGPERPDIRGLGSEAAELVLSDWRKKRKAFTDKKAAQLRKQIRITPDDSGIAGAAVEIGQYTGVLSDTLRMMTVVDEFPLKVGHTFPCKELVLMRIAEEANIAGCPVSLVRSDDKRVHAHGRNGSSLSIKAGYSNKFGWKVYKYDTHSAPSKTSTDSDINVAPLKDTGLGSIEEGTADGVSDNDTNKESDVPSLKGDRSPFKTKWIVPLLSKEISESPNMPRKHIQNILAHYIKAKFLSRNLIANAKNQARLEVFGNPDDNVHLVTTLVEEMKSRGHEVQLVLRSATEVTKMLEKMVVTEESNKRKGVGDLMTRQDKVTYLKSWKVANMQMLIDAGLDPVTQGIMEGHTTSKFVSGLFFSTSAAKNAVPLLQQVFQGDACHMNFGKYMLYSMYGTTANGNTFCVGVGIHFGNESKEDWEQYFNFVKSVHPCLNNYKNTFITDQAKGLIEAIKLVFPQVGHFHCSYHRRQNILKIVKGGTQMYSCLWVYNLCMQASNITQLDQIKHNNAVHVDEKAWKYLNTIPDTAQYPAARVGMGEGIYMYHHSASSASEAMNQANKPVREKTAVDVVNAIMLLLKLDSKRHQEHKVMAWKWNEFLTPYGKKLRDTQFALVKNQRLYDITISETDDIWWICRVVRTNNNERRCWFLKTPVMGSVFGGCSCGAPLTDGVPCHHMIAVVKSSRIKGLNENNAMPCWWTTEMWRLQYPLDSTVLCDFDMNTLKDKHTVDTTMRYCPPYVAPTKAGRPKTEMRLKSSLEGNINKRKKKSIGETMEQESKKAKTMKKKTGGK